MSQLVQLEGKHTTQRAHCAMRWSCNLYLIMTYTTYMWELFTLLFAFSFHVVCLNPHLNPMCSSALLNCPVQTLSFWLLWSHNLAHIGALLFQWGIKYKTNAFLSSKDRKLDILWSATEIPNRFRIEGKIWSSFPFVPPLVPQQCLLLKLSRREVQLMRNRHRGFSWKQTSTNKNKSLMAKLSQRFRPPCHHIWRRICDIDWLKLLQILLARHRTFRLFMLERALNGPIFHHRLNSAFSRGAVDYFQLPPSIGCLELQFNLDRQSLKAETFSIKEFYSGFSTRIKLFISSTTAGSFNK